jgi:hypothetical protein
MLLEERTLFSIAALARIGGSLFISGDTITTTCQDIIVRARLGQTFPTPVTIDKPLALLRMLDKQRPWLEVGDSMVMLRGKAGSTIRRTAQRRTELKAAVARLPVELRGRIKKVTTNMGTFRDHTDSRISIRDYDTETVRAIRAALVRAGIAPDIAKDITITQ